MVKIITKIINNKICLFLAIDNEVVCEIPLNEHGEVNVDNITQLIRDCLNRDKISMN